MLDLIEFAIAICLAVIGVLGAYRYNLLLARRKDQLERVNYQLGDLYGPLLSLVSTAKDAWQKFCALYRPEGSLRNSPPPTDEQKVVYRLWMDTLFMPLNRRMMEVILSQTHLIDEPGMPRCFLDLLAHVATYEPVIKQWQDGDTSVHVSAGPFPKDELEEHVTTRYRVLKAEQARLLGALGAS